MCKSHAKELRIFHGLALACLALASPEGRGPTSSEMMQEAQPVQSHELKTAKDELRRKRSMQTLVGLSSKVRSTTHPLKLLLLGFSHSALPQTAFTAPALVGQSRVGCGAKMVESAATPEDLEMQLDLALNMEDYKKAARLRDELKAARRANPIDALLWEREKTLNKSLTDALSEAVPHDSRMQAGQTITEMALPPMPAQGAEDALHRILLETTGQIQASAERALWAVWTKSGNEEIDKLYQQARSNVKAENYHKAVDTLTAVTEKAPDFAEGWNERAVAYCLMEDLDRAMEDWKQVLKLKPRHFGAMSSLGQCLVRKGELAEGVKYLKAAMRDNPNYNVTLQGKIASIEDVLGVQSQMQSRIITLIYCAVAFAFAMGALFGYDFALGK